MDISAHFKSDLPEQVIPLDGETTVTFKPITPRRFEEINKLHTREKFKRGQAVSKTNWERVIDDILDETVIDWHGLEADGGPIEVTRENKRKLYDFYNTFRAAFTDVVMGSLGDERDFSEELEGN